MAIAEINKKIVSLKKIKNLLPANKIIVTTNGAFDLFHIGHLKTLEFAKKQGDILIVLLNSDSSIKKYKSEKRPIIPQKYRAKILASIEYVDYVVIFNEKTPVKALSIIKPNIHVKGSEYKKKLIERDIVEKNNGKIIFLERKNNPYSSTTNIIKKILKRYR